jgi:hypothetical protein
MVDNAEDTTVVKMKKTMMSFIRNANNISQGTRATGGGEKIGKWQDSFDVMAINPLLPLFRTIEGTDHTMFVIDTDVKILTPYVSQLKTKEQQRKMVLTAVMKFWEEWDKDHLDAKFFDYVSGKGMYRVQRYNKPVSKLIFLPVLWDEANVNGLFKKSEGFKLYYPKKKDGKKAKQPQGVCKKFTYEKIDYLVIVDTSLYKRGGHIFRTPYSAYQKFGYKTFYCVPVVKNDDGYDIGETIRRTELQNLTIEPIEVPSFQFSEFITRKMGGDDLEALSKKIVKSGGPRGIKRIVPYYQITAPEPDDLLDDKQQRKVDEMYDMISNKDPAKTPPCIRNAYDSGGHHKNVVLLRYLASMNYPYYPHGKNYSPSDIAMLFRFKINDEEDNKRKNKNKLFDNIRAYLGNPKEPDKPPSCAKMQDPNSEFYFCDPVKDGSRCERTYCMRKKPSPSILTVERDKSQTLGFETITSLASNMIMQPDKHFEAIKTTRAGLTTTIIRAATFHQKRILVLVPTNEIARSVFTKALKLVYEKYGEKIDGAVLSSNKTSCLKLTFNIEDLRKKKKENPDWGPSKRVEWEHLPFHSKPSCVIESEDGQRRECPHYREVYTFPHRTEDGTPYPIIDSDNSQYKLLQVKQGYCAYQTVMQRIFDYDVLFITYDKMASLIMNTEKESQSLLGMIFDAFDVVFLDEISNLVQASPLSVTVYEETLADMGKKQIQLLAEDFIMNLNTELSKIDSPPNMFNKKSFEPYSTTTMDNLRLLTTEFCLHYDRFIRERKFAGEFDDVKCWKIENFLLNGGKERLDEFRENFFAYYSLISNYTKKTNESLPNLIKMISLLQSDIWWLQSTPTVDKRTSASFVTSPKIRKVTGFINEMHSRGKQIILTDATMPLAKPSDIFGLDFERFIIGDPRNTCDKQLVIADTKTRNVKDLLMKPPKRIKNQEYNDDMLNLISFINEVCQSHGTENVLVVIPNKVVFFILMDLKRKKLIPPKVSVTYYRSEETIGVEKSERVMISICPPTPPRYSSLWLANYYQEQGLFVDDEDVGSVRELSLRLERMNEHQTFYQTIGRVKDPSSQVFSVVYCWGISYKKVIEIIQMDEDVPIPRVVNVSHMEKNNSYMTIIGKAWKRFGILLDQRFIKLFKHLRKHKMVSFSSANRIMGERTNTYIQELTSFKGLLEFFGITVIEHDVTGQKLLTIETSQ